MSPEISANTEIVDHDSSEWKLFVMVKRKMISLQPKRNRRQTDEGYYNMLSSFYNE